MVLQPYSQFNYNSRSIPEILNIQQTLSIKRNAITRMPTAARFRSCLPHSKLHHLFENVFHNVNWSDRPRVSTFCDRSAECLMVWQQYICILAQWTFIYTYRSAPNDIFRLPAIRTFVNQQRHSVSN